MLTQIITPFESCFLLPSPPSSSTHRKKHSSRKNIAAFQSQCQHNTTTYLNFTRPRAYSDSISESDYLCLFFRCFILFFAFIYMQNPWWRLWARRRRRTTLSCSQLSMSRAWPRKPTEKKTIETLESDLRKQRKKTLCSSVNGDWVDAQNQFFCLYDFISRSRTT